MVVLRRSDPWLSFKADFVSVKDTRAGGLNPLLDGELWVNPRGGAINVRKGARGVTLCSGLRGRRADLSVDGCTLSFEGLFQVELKTGEDVARLRDALLFTEGAPSTGGDQPTGGSHDRR